MTRAVCYSCHKPETHCVCGSVPRVQNRTAVHILQHPGERFHPVGTVRLARLGLARVNVEVHWPDDGAAPRLKERLSPGAGVLFPSPGAVDLRTLPPEQRPSELVLLDGTWSTVRALYRGNRWLDGWPHYRILPASPSLYRIRKEPGAHCLSTIEALVRALKVLEPDTVGLDELLGAFRDMVARQEHYVRSAASPRRRRPRPLRPPPIPAALHRGLTDLVAVYGEVVPVRDDRAGRLGDLCYWVAFRLGDGASFACAIHPEAAELTERHRRHMGLSVDDLAGACQREQFVARWRAFVRPSDVLVCWRHVPLQALARLCKTDDPRAAGIVLKAVYCNLRHRGCGHLADVVAREGLSAPEASSLKRFRGRAAQRLADTVAVLQWAAKQTGADGVAENACDALPASTPPSGRRSSGAGETPIPSR